MILHFDNVLIVASPQDGEMSVDDVIQGICEWERDTSAEAATQVIKCGS